jgi:predicted amidohydrolase YtcJ
VSESGAPSTFALSGRIVTMSARSDAQAVIVRNGLIEEVGDRGLVTAAQEASLPVVDLGNQAVLPGFVDPHAHINMLALSRATGVDCRVEQCPSVESVLSQLAEARDASKGRDQWIEGYGSLFYAQKLQEGRLPTRKELDSVSRRMPIVLHCGGHASLLNTAALKRVGIERFLTGRGGIWGAPVIELDENGEPTGLIAEIDPHIPTPVPDEATVSDELARTYRERFTRHGVTAFGEMAASSGEIERMSRLIASGAIPARGFAYLIAAGAAEVPAAVDWATAHPGRFGLDVQTAGVKLFVDGGFSSYNAAVRTPFLQPYAPRYGARGRLNLTYPELVATLRAVQAARLQLALHTNGERAQDEVIDAALDVDPGYHFPYLRMEHAGNLLTTPAELRRWRRAGAIPVLQPGFVYDFIGDFVPEVMGEEGRRGRLPLRTLLDDGMRPAASSDVGPANSDQQSNPLFSVQCCVERHGYWGRPVEPEERITAHEALRLHTIEAARALRADDRIGSIEPGKAADFVVLEQDPRTVDAHTISDIAVARVYRGGQLTLDATNPASTDAAAG